MGMKLSRRMVSGQEQKTYRCYYTLLHRRNRIDAIFFYTEGIFLPKVRELQTKTTLIPFLIYKIGKN